MFKKIIYFTARTKEEYTLLYAIVSVLIAIGVVCLVGLFLFLSNIPSAGEIVEVVKTGQLGDTFNGLTAPIITVCAAILTFSAFWVQYEANKQQRLDLKRERFENKFYEMLRLHKENLQDVKVGYGKDRIEGRKAFVSLYIELRYTYAICKETYTNMKSSCVITDDISDERLVKLAYIFFYAGIGDNSDIVNEAMNSNPKDKFSDTLFLGVRRELYRLKKMQYPQRPIITDDENNIIKSNRFYTPWDGHLSKFGHYYRHLFQTVYFVAIQDEKFINRDDKLSFLRTLRAQLSDHEQLMLYYNAIATFGERWIKDTRNNDTNYFTDYYMIHNIPIPLAHFGVKPQVKFWKEYTEDDGLFEWLE
jgi:hypothetical protein